MNKIKQSSQMGLGFGFESPNQGQKDEWLTPKRILDALGSFDLDPCSPINRPWSTAARHLTIEDDGLKTDWGGQEVRVYCNPPYGPHTKTWIDRMARHGNGIALIFARTETATFDLIWQHASAYLFLSRRLKFYHVDGKEGASATAPSVLLAFDNEYTQGRNALALAESGLKGAFFGSAVAVGGTTTHEKLERGLAAKQSLQAKTVVIAPLSAESAPFPTPWVLHDMEWTGTHYEGGDDAGDKWRAVDGSRVCDVCRNCDFESGYERLRDGLYGCMDCVTI